MKQIIAAAAIAALAPAFAGAVTTTGNINSGDTVDVNAPGGYEFNADFLNGDAAGTFIFTFENNSATDVSITMAFATVNQGGANFFFTNGVESAFVSGSDAFTTQGALDSFTLTTTIAAGSSDELVINYGAAVSAFQKIGPEIDFRVVARQTNPVPLPAALPLFAAALGGLGFVSRRKA